MNRLIISAPFGNYLSFDGVTSTIGSYTLRRRGGRLSKLWRVGATLRYRSGVRAWTNKLGLPNPGIGSLSKSEALGKVLSIHASSSAEWLWLAAAAMIREPLAVELNLSCPNAQTSVDVTEAVKLIQEAGLPIVAKLPPLRWDRLAKSLRQLGVSSFHCCNTIPVRAGGMSGEPLKQFSIWAVETLRRAFGSTVMLIGGGGVNQLQDVSDYVSAGADRVAIASMLLNPFSWKRVEAFRTYLDQKFSSEAPGS